MRLLNIAPLKHLKKITLNQKGSGVFSFLLPMLASTIIPALIPKKRGSGIPNKNNFFLNE